MTELEPFQQDAMDYFKSIDSLDKLKETWDTYLDHTEELLKFAVKNVEDFAENHENMETAEKLQMISDFMDESYPFPGGIAEEMVRIDYLPDASAWFEEKGPDFESRLAPYMHKFGEIITPIAQAEMMGNMEQMMDAFGVTIEAANADMMENVLNMLEGGMEEDDRIKIPELDEMYLWDSSDEIEENWPAFLDYVEEIFDEYLEHLTAMKEANTPWMDEAELIEKIDRHRIVWPPEIEKQLDVLGENFNNKEFTDKAKKQFFNRVNFKLEQIRGLLNTLMGV